MAEIKNLLLVDDDETTVFFTKFLLSKYNANIILHTVGNGQQALDKLAELAQQQVKIDLVLLDINMPVMNGFEFMEAYKNIEENQKARVVICTLTTSKLSSDYEEAKRYSEINGFMEKPISNEKLDEITATYFTN